MFKRVHALEEKVEFFLESGLPSGSLWTSILGSIINVIIIEEFKKEKSYSNVDYFVYGDDHVLMVNEDVDADKFKVDYEQFVHSTFGMNLNPQSSYISRREEFFVKYKRPVFSTKEGYDLSKGTSALQAVKFEFSDKPFTEYSYEKGTTHRWNYVFSKRVKFLQYYWNSLGQSLRPWPESLVRMINPERPIKTVDDCRLLYISHLIDNYHNAHARNWIYHLMYDLSHIQKLSNDGKHLSLVADFFREEGAFKMFNQSEGPYEFKIGSRGWYRKIDYKVNLFEEPIMRDFNYEWKELDKLINDLIYTVPQEELFKKKDILRVLIDKSITIDNKDYMKEESDAPFKNRSNLFSFCILLLLNCFDINDESVALMKQMKDKDFSTNRKGTRIMNISMLLNNIGCHDITPTHSWELLLSEMIRLTSMIIKRIASKHKLRDDSI